MLIRKRLEPDLYVIFILQTIFQNIKLQDTNDANNNLFHTGVKLLKDLDRALLCDLGDSLYKLFPLHGIHLTHPRKMLRRKGRNSFILELLLRHA